jgi:hypothetical protein
MSIEKEQIIHIVSEVVIIAGISIYFHYQNKKQSERINELETVVLQLQDYVGKQEDTISKLCNDVSLLSMNLQNVNKSIQNLSVDNKPIQNKDEKTSKKKNTKKINNENIQMFPHPQQFPFFPNLVPMTSIPQEPIVIMEMNTPIQKPNKVKQEIKVEEVIENLDKELEDELKELENDTKETFKDENTKVTEIKKKEEKHVSDHEDESNSDDSEEYSSDEETS